MASVQLDRPSDRTRTAKRNARNRVKRASLLPDAYTISRRLSEKASFAQIRTDFDLDTLLVYPESRRWLRRTSIQPLCLEVLKSDSENTCIHWDGSPHAIMSGPHVFAALPGWPMHDLSWPDAVKRFNQIAGKLYSTAVVVGAISTQGDGVIKFGVSCGLGRARPVNLRLSPELRDVLQNFGSTRIAMFASGSFAFYAPKVYRTYADKLQGMFERMPYIQGMVSKSVFTTASFDFSNGRPCRAHDDHPNGSAGWCALFAGGDFDPSMGGHLFLPQAQLIIEFPPGATILIPSTLVYGIVPVPTGQTRYTFSQYIPVDVVRYIDNGYRTRCEVFKDTAMRTDGPSQPLESRTQRDLELLSRFDELHSDRMSSGLVF